MRKILSLIICVVLLGCVFAIGTSAAVPDESAVMPCYNNTIMTKSNFNIDENGVATVTVSYFGYNGVTLGGKITTKIEKLISGNWVTVNIGTTDNTWIDESSSVNFRTTHTVQLTSSGTYRAVIEYRVWGNGGAEDVIPATIEKTY